MYQPLEHAGLPCLEDLYRLTAAFPGATAVALASNGLDWVPLPDEVAGLFVSYEDSTATNPHARNSLEMLETEDRIAAIVGFEKCRRLGYADCRIRPFGSEDYTALTFWDFRERFGSVLVILVPGLDTTVGSDPDFVSLRPRRLHHTATDAGQFSTVDDATTVLLGWTREELVGSARLDYVHPDDQDRAISNWIELLAWPGQSRRVRLRYRHSDGSWVWFEITQTNRLHDLGVVDIELVDISEEQAAMSALQDRERLLARLTEALPTGILHLGTNNEVLFVNDRFAEITGWSASDRSAYERSLSAEDRAALRGGLSAAHRGIDTDLEMSFERRDGQVLRCQVSIRPVEGENGGCLLCIDDITERWLMQQQLSEQATTDQLTGLANRAHILELLATRLSDSGPDDRTAAVFIDMDGFKTVNDEHGHAAGDRLLVEVADALRQSIRPFDLVGRLGGDEFLAICALGPDDDAGAMVSRLRDAATRVVAIDGSPVVCSASCGLAITGNGALSADELVALADAAMYEEKSSRTGYRVSGGDNTSAPPGL